MMKEENFKISFIDKMEPELEAGEYIVTAGIHIKSINYHQTSSDKKADINKAKTIKILPNTLRFIINAHRFSLPPSEIFSTYPSGGQKSNFANTVPHIIFNDQTLPWIRTTNFIDKEKNIPWLILVLISEEDNNKFVTRKSIKGEELKSFLDDKNSDVPKLLINETEINNLKGKLFDILEVKQELVTKILPAKEILPYLAHVRKVGITKYKEGSHLPQESNSKAENFEYYSSIICGHPIPKIEKSDLKKINYTAYLLSIEGYSDTLWTPTNTKKTTNFFCLYSFDFVSERGESFFELCEKITPKQFNVITKQNEANAPLQKKLGYIPVKHLLRTGKEIISFYKGPLAPQYFHDNKSGPKLSSDQALHFDNETGIFDISYAAAWQLGQLLALQDKEFSNNLFLWQLELLYKDEHEKSLDALINRFSNEKTGIIKPENNNFILEDILSTYCASINNEHHSNDDKSVGIKKILKDEKGKITKNKIKVPEIVQKKLFEWACLDDIPLNYLIPNKKLLERDTLSLFFIDEIWIRELLSGALSIATTAKNHSLIDEVFNSMITRGKVLTARCGFLFRSDIIKGWRGVEIFATAENESKKLEPHKIKIFNNDILFCLFNQQVHTITIVQPLESLHFRIAEKEKHVKDAKGNLIKYFETDSLTSVVSELKKNEKVNFTSASLAKHLTNKPIVYKFQLNH